MSEDMKSGLMAPVLGFGMMEPIVISAKENDANMKRVLRDWMLGPEKGSPEPDANAEYWNSIADAWNIPVEKARRQVCANCEYFCNTPDAMESMDAVPYNTFDETGGGRGYCRKFDFICHNLRTCQAWEEDD